MVFFCAAEQGCTNFKLQYLSLVGMPFTSIHECYGTLASLTHLTLSSTEIINIPWGIVELPNLVFLSLSGSRHLNIAGMFPDGWP